MKKWLCILLAAVIFSGCSVKTTSLPETAVVNQITVTYQDGNSQIVKNYTSQHKMRQILNKFRLLGQQYNPLINPENLDTTLFQVRLSFSDGSQRLYHTRSDRYIRTDDGPWRQTDAQRLQALNELLRQLPPDAQ